MSPRGTFSHAVVRIQILAARQPAAVAQLVEALPVYSLRINKTTTTADTTKNISSAAASRKVCPMQQHLPRHLHEMQTEKQGIEGAKTNRT